MKVLVLLSLLCVAPGIAGAQAGNTCRLSVDSTRRQGNFQGNNMFAGGGVFISCFGTRIHMSSDSVAYYAPPIDLVQFIGNVKYEDTTITMTANNGTYFKNGERWEARGNVVTRNLETGSTLTGPSLDYYRALGEDARNDIFFAPPMAAIRTSLIYAGSTVVLALLVGLPAS